MSSVPFRVQQTKAPRPYVVGLICAVSVVGLSLLVLGARNVEPDFSPPENPYRISPQELTGEWESTFGLVKLSVQGHEVNGTYAYRNGSVTVNGSVAGHLDDAGKTQLSWKETSGNEGRAVWYATNEATLTGVWGAGSSERNGGEWKLQKKNSGK